MSNKKSVIQFAEDRLADEVRQRELGLDNSQDVQYWASYLDGARAQLKECKSRLIGEYYKACLDGKVQEAEHE